MTVSGSLRGVIPIVLCILVSQLFGQEAATPAHSWDVLMNRPEAKDAANKLVGHCGDAETQDVMNACFALEFKNANRQMNSTLEVTLKQLDAKDRKRVSELPKERGCSIATCIVRPSGQYKLALGAWNRLK